MRKYLQLVFLAVSVFCSEILLAESRDPVRILDLRTLNELDLKEQEKAEQLWDIMHTTATLQGIVNRNSPRLYIRYVKNGQGENVDDYWWNKYRQAGQWLAGRDTVAYTELSDVVTVFRKEIRGVVVYDSKVASTSNIASSVAGIENLIAVRYDISPNSLYTRLVLQGPKLAGEQRWFFSFHGQRKDCRNRSTFDRISENRSLCMVYREILEERVMQYGVRRLLHRPVLAYRSYPDGNEPSPVDQS